MSRMEANRWLYPLRRGLTAALDTLFPPHCVFCSVELDSPCMTESLCQACRSSLTQTAEPACLRCGALTPGGISQSDRCGHCQKLDFRFSTAIPYGWYRGDLKQAIKRMKYAHGDPLAAAVSRFAANRWKVALADYSADVIVPVPSYWIRRFQRGTHSPDLFAKQAGKRMGVTTIGGLLQCCRKVNKQSMLSPGDRIQNVQGAFRVAKGYDIRGARVVLVDDVLTTGATANEATKTLLVAGAASVAVAVVARALPNQ